MPLSELWELYETALLALVIWREARSEGNRGMTAVACSIRNRVDRPSWWGNDFGTVITKKWQYSSMGAPGDPQLIRFPDANDSAFAEALEIADSIIQHETVPSPMPGADSFYDTSIAPPSWATPDKYVGQVGTLKFYNVDLDYELPAANPPVADTGLKPVQPTVKSWWEKLWG